MYCSGQIIYEHFEEWTVTDFQTCHDMFITAQFMSPHHCLPYIYKYIHSYNVYTRWGTRVPTSSLEGVIFPSHIRVNILKTV